MGASVVNAYVAIGLILGSSLLVVVFVVMEGRRRRFPDLASLVQILLASTGVTAGVRVAVLTITHDDLGPFQGEDKIYLILGALALVVASVQTIVATFLLWC